MKIFKFIILLFAFSILLVAQKMTDIKSSQLPKASLDYIQKNLPGAKIVRAAKIEQKGSINYNVVIEKDAKKHVLVFDKDGRFLKKSDDMVGSQPKSKTKTKTSNP